MIHADLPPGLEAQANFLNEAARNHHLATAVRHALDQKAAAEIKLRALFKLSLDLSASMDATLHLRPKRARGVRTTVVDRNENPVNSLRARYLLANCQECVDCVGSECKRCGGTSWVGQPWSVSRLSAIKRLMGIKGRYLFLSQVRQFLLAHLAFKLSDANKQTTVNPQP